MKNLKDYIDDFNMIVTQQKDGGDSCAYGFAIFYACAVLHKPLGVNLGQTQNSYAKALEKEPGRYCRHPDPTKWYSRINTFSRDQMTPLLVYLGLLGFRLRLSRLFIAHLKRLLLFAWNTRQNNSYPGQATYRWKLPDITGPDIWALYIRGFHSRLLYPLLLLFDIQTLIGVLLYRFGVVKTTLQMNQVLIVDFSNRVMPTPVSWLAKKVYGIDAPIKALEDTFDPDWQPPVNDYLVPVVQTWD